MCTDKSKLLYLCLFVFICGFSSTLFGQIELPLQGYYRPGKFMPVLVESGDLLLQIQSPGIVTAQINRAGIVPLLMLDSTPSMLNVGSGEFPLHALSPDQRLIGLAVDDDSHLAEKLFPNQEIIRVHLDSPPS